MILFRNRNYALLWSSQLISQLGNWALLAALPFFVFQLTGSVLATGTMFLVQVVPPILLGSMAGVFVDRWDRRWTMIGANVARGLILLLLLALRSAEQVWIVYVVAFFESAANLFFSPANNALLPKLVSEDELVSANALDALGENIARILGPGLGGVVLAVADIGMVALINFGTYLVGTVLIFLIQVPAPSREVRSIAETDRSFRDEWMTFWRNWLEGLRLVSQRRPLAFVFLTVGVAMIGDSIMGVLLVVFVQEVVGAGAQEFGWILTARGIGGLLGGLTVARIGTRIDRKDLMAFGMLGAGAFLAAVLLIPTLPAVLTMAVLIGLPVMAWTVAAQTWLQLHSDDEYRGRIFGSLETYTALMSLLGIAFATLSGESIGVIFSLSVAASLFMVGGLLAFLLLQPRFLNQASETADNTT